MLVCETDDPFPCEGRVKLFGKSLSHAGHGLCLDMHCECPFLAEDCLLKGFYEGLLMGTQTLILGESAARSDP
jgi:hypothetical protein